MLSVKIQIQDEVYQQKIVLNRNENYSAQGNTGGTCIPV